MPKAPTIETLLKSGSAEWNKLRKAGKIGVDHTGATFENLFSANADLSGLDVGWRIRKEYQHLEPKGVRRPLVADRLCQLQRFGQKTGAGWYKYDPSDRTRMPDPEVEKIVEECARAAGIDRRSISDHEIVERTIYALITEGARILEEGIALRAVDIDIIYIYGYGFPAHRGGPMWYAGTVGLKEVYDRIRQFRDQHGDFWEPPPLLRQLAERGNCAPRSISHRDQTSDLRDQTSDLEPEVEV